MINYVNYTRRTDFFSRLKQRKIVKDFIDNAPEEYQLQLQNFKPDGIKS